MTTDDSYSVCQAFARDARDLELVDPELEKLEQAPFSALLRGKKAGAALAVLRPEPARARAAVCEKIAAAAEKALAGKPRHGTFLAHALRPPVAEDAAPWGEAIGRLLASLDKTPAPVSWLDPFEDKLPMGTGAFMPADAGGLEIRLFHLEKKGETPRAPRGAEAWLLLLTDPLEGEGVRASFEPAQTGDSDAFSRAYWAARGDGGTRFVRL